MYSREFVFREFKAYNHLLDGYDPAQYTASPLNTVMQITSSYRE